MLPEERLTPVIQVLLGLTENVLSGFTNSLGYYPALLVAGARGQLTPCPGELKEGKNSFSNKFLKN